jgi:hypothetical protein
MTCPTLVQHTGANVGAPIWTKGAAEWTSSRSSRRGALHVTDDPVIADCRLARWCSAVSVRKALTDFDHVPEGRVLQRFLAPLSTLLINAIRLHRIILVEELRGVIGRFDLGGGRIATVKFACG